MDAETRSHILEAVEAALAGAGAVAVATVTEGGTPALAEAGEKMLVRASGDVVGTLGDAALDEAASSAAREAFQARPRIRMETIYLGRDGRTVTRRSQAQPGDAQVMLQLFEAPVRLVIVGGGHVGLALAELGEALGYGITVIDDRPEFANRERFPMAEHVVVEEPAEAFAQVALDESAYVVLVSRGHRVDEEALRQVVGRGAAYVGMIGSRRRTATVLRHMLEEGVDPASVGQISTPIGLDIGAETPEEIAVSILAEITMLRRGATGRRMVERRDPLE
ncbi:MAG: XdhC family protein [Chloroflexi bacterium]|nr:XdhC family protein [Chloroflexota bacterium]MDA1240874.1 XdhC family protein [Chloroflexota bacterium]